MKRNPDSATNDINTPGTSSPCPWADEEKRRVVAFFDLLYKWGCEQKEKAKNDRPGKD